VSDSAGSGWTLRHFRPAFSPENSSGVRILRRLCSHLSPATQVRRFRQCHRLSARVVRGPRISRNRKVHSIPCAVHEPHCVLIPNFRPVDWPVWHLYGGACRSSCGSSSGLLVPRRSRMRTVSRMVSYLNICATIGPPTSGLSRPRARQPCSFVDLVPVDIERKGLGVFCFLHGVIHGLFGESVERVRFHPFGLGLLFVIGEGVILAFQSCVVPG
jgi:hypothetical protein